MITLPTKIHLTAIKAHWKVSYVKTPGKLILIEHPGRELVLYGRHYSKRAAIDVLLRWVRLKAHYHLFALVRKLNRRVRVNYKKIIIRLQATCWGSYTSTTKTISLNYLLMFLPPALVKHLVYHELCHGRYPEHSTKFWKEVGKYDKKWKSNSRGLIDAENYIPPWIIS